jgi:hypothetical protein
MQDLYDSSSDSGADLNVYIQFYLCLLSGHYNIGTKVSSICFGGQMSILLPEERLQYRYCHQQFLVLMFFDERCHLIVRSNLLHHLAVR